MKQALRKELETFSGSFIIRKLTEPHFDPNWHFHPHFQLFLVVRGTGTRFIGDSIRPFSEGELVLLGPDIPHLWRSDPPYFEPHSHLFTEGIVLYFTDDFLGNVFLQKPEMSALRQLLEHSRRGMEWLGRTRDWATGELKKLLSLPPTFERVLALLSLLHRLSLSSDYRFISSQGYTNTHKPSETNRMQAVHDYVLARYTSTIHLEEVAALVGMSPSAFCRYFKARANKTFSEFVGEVRVGQACRLLQEDNLNITQISYECGFRTLSNFNRQFREITGQTPSEYKRRYRDV
ncbi:AraC family transcriptional regulator [Tellurirhabdus rosea]|uniref:AraC family transcriptional regulator n=1 Tax=Tellurirhabdus rosea TaxID=2674997 RepID=UPI00225A93B1|nr:AraC family transcriptional regulator [Tellurirhabdus rosea]